MYIKSIEVKNFKQLKDIELNLDEKNSILAGPNNSGKTSLILLMKRILMDNNFKLKSNDFNVYDSSRWLKDFVECLTKNISNSSLNIEALNNDDDEKLWMPNIEIKLQINYHDKDNIEDFAKYLLDLDESKSSFYFVYKIVIKKEDFLNDLRNNSETIIRLIENSDKHNNASALSRLLIKLYCKNCVTHIYYCDSDYNNAIEINNQKEFHNLFNIKYIPAARLLEDGYGDNHELSSGLVSFAKNDDNWNSIIDDTSKAIYETVNSNVLEIDQKSSESLKNVIKAVSNSNGGHIDDIVLDVDVSEDDIQNLINNTTYAQYTVTGKGKSKGLKYVLNETSQGLGYSNLVYLDTQIESFIRDSNTEKNLRKINFLVIEEPESHMHPQMQIVFSKQLIDRLNDNYDNNLQGLITTHSTEIVRGTNPSSLRILRENTKFNSKVCDLGNAIKTGLKENNNVGMDLNIKSFYQIFGIAELIFADRAILFEGDTERLYLKYVINNDDNFDILRKKYIAFVQVGGAYAFVFEKLLETLGVKTLILTDADYVKEIESEEDISETNLENLGKCVTTNATIKEYIQKEYPKEDINKAFYQWLDPIDKSNPNSAGGKVVYTIDEKKLNGDSNEKDSILLTYQSKEDNYTRTLEAAMLSKKLNIEPFGKMTKSNLIKFKNKSGLKFSIPQKERDITLIDILESTSGNKTDFMYSVILNDYAIEMLPHYIEEGLKWLQK